MNGAGKCKRYQSLQGFREIQALSGECDNHYTTVTEIQALKQRTLLSVHHN